MQKTILLQITIFFFYVSSHFAYGGEVNLISSQKKSNISIALKSGVSFNKGDESNLQNLGFPAPSKTSTCNGAVIRLDAIFPFTSKLSAIISGIFMPKRRFKSSGNIEPSNDFYLNSSIASYGVMGGLIYELYKYNRFSQYISAKAGMVLNKIGNSTLITTNYYRVEPPVNVKFFHSEQFNFAWQFATGIKYAVSNIASLGLEYAYLNRGRVATNGAIDVVVLVKLIDPDARIKAKNLVSHQILLGVEFAI